MPPELDAELRAIRARALAPTGTWVQDRADRDALLAHITAFEIMRTELAEVLRQQALDARTIEHLGQQATHAQSRYDALDADFKALEQGAHRLATELDEARTLLATATTAAFSHVTKLMEVERERDDARRLAAEADARARDAYNRAIGTKQNSDVWIDQRNKAEAERDTLAAKLAEVELRLAGYESTLRTRDAELTDARDVIGAVQAALHEARGHGVGDNGHVTDVTRAVVARLAEVERERDEARRRCMTLESRLRSRPSPEAAAEQRSLPAEVESLRAELTEARQDACSQALSADHAEADSARLLREVERMRPVVEAAQEYVWARTRTGLHDVARWQSLCDAINAIGLSLADAERLKPLLDKILETDKGIDEIIIERDVPKANVACAAREATWK